MEGVPRICVSPILNDHESNRESEEGKSQHPPHCPILAEETLVYEPDQPASRHSTNSANKERQTETTRDSNILPSTTEPEINIMAYFRECGTEAGLSERAAEMAAKHLRTSTREVYDCRLQRFLKWCQQLQVDPCSATLGKIADFLLLLFDEGLSISTIRGYRSAIASIHQGFDNGETVSNSISLARLTKAFFLQKPPTRKLLPKWDLPSVMRALNQPTHKSSLLNLSVKTAFLIAIASGSRRGLIQALSMESGHIRWEKDKVRMIPRAGFLAKNQKEGSKPCEIILPTIKSSPQ